VKSLVLVVFRKQLAVSPPGIPHHHHHHSFFFVALGVPAVLMLLVIVSWPLSIQNIVLCLGFCARIGTNLYAPTLCFSHPTTVSAHTIVQYNAPRQPPRYCNIYQYHTILAMAISCKAILAMAISCKGQIVSRLPCDRVDLLYVTTRVLVYLCSLFSFRRPRGPLPLSHAAGLLSLLLLRLRVPPTPPHCVVSG